MKDTGKMEKIENKMKEWIKKHYPHGIIVYWDYHDDLSPVLEKIEKADAIILGSPIYFGNVTGELRSFMERTLFQYLVYDKDYSSLATKKKKVSFIYTMNVTEEQAAEWGYPKTVGTMEKYFAKIFGATEALYVYNTYQFPDYANYVSTSWDETAKAKQRDEVFPEDCQKAFALGARALKPNNKDWTRVSRVSWGYDWGQSSYQS